MAPKDRLVPLPNLRKLFRTDPGYLIADVDLAGADARVVAWDSNDLDLMDAFDAGLKVHAKNALDMLGPASAGDDGTKEPTYTKCKQAVHGSNYVGGADAIAAATGWSVAFVESFQRRWFQRHPRIRQWHDRVEAQVLSQGFVENKFGYRIYYPGRREGLLPEALAWIAQSTVAIASFKGAIKVRSEIPEIQILLQDHDSLVLQYPREFHKERARLREALEVIVPYEPRPMRMPWGLKVSDRSWGEVQKCEWEGDDKWS